jgi:flagellar capping protein FliD
VSRNTSGVSQKVQAMVKAYNELLTELKNQTEYDSSTKSMGILSTDMAVSYIKTQSSNPFIGIATGFVQLVDSFVQASDIGITFDGEGMMQLDNADFNAAINKNFKGVLSLLGANKTSNNDTGIIEFYGSSEKYTSAGAYDIQVDIGDNHQITDVRIKLATETEWRHAAWNGNIARGNSTFDDKSNPLFPENGLQFTVDLTQSAGTYSSSINVKQGIVNKLDNYMAEVLKNDGRLDISTDVINDKIKTIKDKITKEQTRLDNYKSRLVDKYARLEKTITMIQQQYSSINQLSA